MASQSSTDEVATPIENPVTPQADDLELSSKTDFPQPASLHTSMLIAGSFVRPSSPTPPPSSQAPPRVAPRSTTPNVSATGPMSSPPTTLVNGHKREVASTGTNAEQLAQCTKKELIEMVEKAKAENKRLDTVASEARMSAAHHQLQYNLLTVESAEALKRMEVERDITRREVEVLQGTGRESINIEYTRKLKEYCKTLEEDLHAAHRRLEKAKRLIEAKEDQLADAKEEIGRLHDRIRQNREHINILRSPGGPLHAGTPKTPATPHYHRGTPRFIPSVSRQVRYPASQDNQEKFNALLLAGSVLSQENNSAPTTPTVARHPGPRTPNKHNRGVQSLSSFPTTPGSVARPMTANATLLPAPEFSQDAERLAQNALQQLNQSQPRRRKSRDSTISASDHEESVRVTNASYREESEELQESQASQTATEMLRADPRESFEVAASRTHTPVPVEKSKIHHQSKLLAPISKGAAEKRKRDEGYGHGPVKKARSDAEAIGLGIGFEPGRA